MPRNRERNLKINRGTTAEEHFLTLSELGRMLQALRENLPGAFVVHLADDQVTVQNHWSHGLHEFMHTNLWISSE